MRAAFYHFIRFPLFYQPSSFVYCAAPCHTLKPDRAHLEIAKLIRYNFHRLTPRLHGRLLSSQLIVLVNVSCLPWITNPNIVNRASRQVSIFSEHVLRQTALLLLVLVLHPDLSAHISSSFRLIEGNLHVIRISKRWSSLPCSLAFAEPPRRLSPAP
jgi:hypothetical protein